MPSSFSVVSVSIEQLIIMVFHSDRHVSIFHSFVCQCSSRRHTPTSLSLEGVGVCVLLHSDTPTVHSDVGVSECNK